MMLEPLRHILRDRPWARAIAHRLRELTHPGSGRVDQSASVLILMYHDMRARDQATFQRQLDSFGEWGEFVTLGAALAHLDGGTGHRVCLTFDDGSRGAFDHALPILADRGAPATFFVVPGWIDEARPGAITWAECRQLHAAGMEIGSHSLTHRRLADLSLRAVTEELEQSRLRIEAEIGAPCVHFACPWGQQDIDFDPARDPGIARRVGYLSFLTTTQRRARIGEDAWALPRIRMEPGWGASDIRYALSR